MRHILKLSILLAFLSSPLHATYFHFLASENMWEIFHKEFDPLTTKEKIAVLEETSDNKTLWEIIAQNHPELFEELQSTLMPDGEELAPLDNEIPIHHNNNNINNNHNINHPPDNPGTLVNVPTLDMSQVEELGNRPIFNGEDLFISNSHQKNIGSSYPTPKTSRSKGVTRGQRSKTVSDATTSTTTMTTELKEALLEIQKAIEELKEKRNAHTQNQNAKPIKISILPTNEDLIYFEENEIARGGIANVYIVEFNDEIVVIKRVREGKQTQEEFERELHVLEHLKKSKGYAKDKRFTFVFDMEGIPLSKITNIPLSLKKAIVIRSFRALLDLHRKRVLHRDLNPGNILIDASPEFIEIHICDFGDSCIIETSEAILQDPITYGSLYYQAFELSSRGLHDYSTRTDYCNLALSVFTLLSKHFNAYINNPRNFEIETTRQGGYVDYEAGFSYAHLQKSCPDLFPSEEELAEIEKEDPVLFELIKAFQWLSQEKPENRPSLEDARKLVKKLENMESEETRHLHSKSKRKFKLPLDGLKKSLGSLSSLRPSPTGGSPKERSPTESPKEHSPKDSTFAESVNDSPGKKSIQSSPTPRGRSRSSSGKMSDKLILKLSGDKLNEKTDTKLKRSGDFNIIEKVYNSSPKIILRKSGDSKLNEKIEKDEKEDKEKDMKDKK